MARISSRCAWFGRRCESYFASADTAWLQGAYGPRLESFNAIEQAGQINAGEDYEIYLRGMDEVIGSMEASKSADEMALKDCVRGAA